MHVFASGLTQKAIQLLAAEKIKFREFLEIWGKGDVISSPDNALARGGISELNAIRFQSTDASTEASQDFPRMASYASRVT